MLIIKINDKWYIGKRKGAAFFARSMAGVIAKELAWLERSNPNQQQEQ